MAKKSDYNSDYMSRKQDAELEQMEKNLSALYADAFKEVQKDFDKFTETFKKQQVQKQKELEEGKITDAEYQIWMQKQVLHTDMYKATISKLTDTMVKADKASMALINGKLPSVVAESYNFTQALGWASAKKSGLNMGTFQVYNARSVQSIMKGSKIMRDVDVPEDEKWNRDKINKAVTTSLLKGDSISKTADALQAVANMDRNSAIRNARTCMTGAENLGRSEAVDDLKAKGIPVNFVWSCVHDARTRETHILLDGTIRDENGYFGADILDVPLRYPADPDGEPEEIYNCRCRASLELEGIDHSNDDELYKQFMMEHDPDSYEAFKDKDAEKEQAFQAHKERAEQRLAERQAEKAQEKDSESGYTEIPAHPIRPRMKDYMDEDGNVDYDRLDSARAEYDRQMEEYKGIRDDFVRRYEETPAMSMPEFNKWCEDHNVEALPSGLQIFNGGTSDVSEMDGRILTMATERCEELFSKFPYVLDFRQDFMNQMGEEGSFHFSIGFAPKEQFVAEAGSGLVFGHNGGNIAEMAREHFDMVSSNGLVSGSGSLTSVIDHEFGHNVEEAIIEKHRLNRFEFEAECGRRLKDLEGASEYSTTKDTERFAEAFSAYIGGEKTPFAKEMGKILKEYGMI